MGENFCVRLSEVIQELSFDIVLMPKDPHDVKIRSQTISRMGLELIGSLENFDNTRIMLMGESETTSSLI